VRTHMNERERERREKEERESEDTHEGDPSHGIFPRMAFLKLSSLQRT